MREPMPSPVVAIGLPRSGSSLLSDILSQTDDYFVFDDLYLYRRAMGLGVTGALTDVQLDNLIDWLGWQVRARIKHGVFDTTRTSIDLEAVDRMDEALRATFQGEDVLWHELLTEWIGRLTLHHGCTRWGFKAPQDFMHIDLYRTLFPGVKFVYLYRDPREMMASLKHVRDQDGDPRQYHPAVYARYWRLASETVERACAAHPGLIHTVRFEDLVDEPQAQAERIAGFLGTRVGTVRTERSNTSFGGGSRSLLTPSETFICERIAGGAMAERGYDLGRGHLRLRDIPDLIRSTLRFGRYQLGRVLWDPSARYAVTQFLRRIRA